MKQDEVSTLLGEKYAKDWKNMSSDEIRTTFTPRVIGGSSLKPTSRAKKEQALQITQIIGQFTRATPIAIVVALKVLAQAFDNVVVSQEDWELIYKGIMKETAGPGPDEQAATEAEQGQQQHASTMADAQAQRAHEREMAQAQPAAPGAQAGGAQGAQPQRGAGGPQVDDIATIVQEVGRLIDGLPPEMKQFLGVQLARGRSVADIATQIIQQMQQGAAA
jgi:hypothetical protein